MVVDNPFVTMMYIIAIQDLVNRLVESAVAAIADWECLCLPGISGPRWNVAPGKLTFV
jgi:hypothetical protein